MNLSRLFILRRVIDDGLHALLVLVGQQGDALMLQQVHARGPARALWHMGQQAGVLDLGMPVQVAPPLLQALQCAGEITTHDIQQMGMQLRVQPLMLLFEIGRVFGLGHRSGGVAAGNGRPYTLG